MESAICDFKHERSLRREWGISESSWKPQETSTQYHSTSSHSNYVEENAVLLSGRKPGFKDDHINLLFLSDTKISVWRKFKKACNESDKQSFANIADSSSTGDANKAQQVGTHNRETFSQLIIGRCFS
ncbi:hypothetical protein P5673_026457 [Acropora cervicornis]|uniref:Uncharacterized protein n=1 Tax=Acropora cervicornis TaxID=6130 RepID=A0AAD9UWK3_ACRCE|nr:hypothetical protein P5673_026457 [Acropora cervicornis]